MKLAIAAIALIGNICIAQMGYGGGGYCANCAMQNSGMSSPGFGYGGMGLNSANTMGSSGQSSYGYPSSSSSVDYSSMLGSSNGYASMYGSRPVAHSYVTGSSGGNLGYQASGSPTSYLSGTQFGSYPSASNSYASYGNGYGNGYSTGVTSQNSGYYSVAGGRKRRDNDEIVN